MSPRFFAQGLPCFTKQQPSPERVLLQRQLHQLALAKPVFLFGFASTFRQLQRQFAGHLQKYWSGHHIVGHTQFARLASPHFFASKAIIQCHLHTGKLCQPLQTIKPRQQPYLHLRQSKMRLGTITHDPCVTGQRHLHPSPQRRTMNGCHKWLRRFVQARQRLVSLPANGQGVVTAHHFVEHL